MLLIDGIAKSFPNPEGGILPIIDIPSWRIDTPEHVAIKGRSGTGKTTFLHLIAGIMRPDRGRILIDGNDIAAMSEPQRDITRARSIGYIFQAFHLLPGYTALENVLLAQDFASKRDPAFARQLFDRVGLADRIHHRPAQLSIGQQQRVALVRALATRPRLVIADEPTGSLDPHHAAQAIALIRTLCLEQQAALLVVTHSPEIIQDFSRVDTFETINRACQQPATTTQASA